MPTYKKDLDVVALELCQGDKHLFHRATRVLIIYY